MPSRKHKKYKLLLDEGLPPKELYSLANNYHNVKHIKHDLRHGGVKDSLVYAQAIKSNRIAVVFNTKDFKKLIRQDTPSVISLSTNLPNAQADIKICKALKGLTPTEQNGHLISITAGGIRVVRVLNNEV